MTEFLKFVLELATQLHAGQFRKNSRLPYIEHPKAVAERVRASVIAYFKTQGLVLTEEVLELFVAVALLHDVLEDTNITAAELESKLLAWISRERVVCIMQALIAITKVKGESYLVYLGRVKNNWIARTVKVEDIQHNMSDLAPGSLYDKYSLALYYLTQ
jgi:(p)ppGpp synthase/HD superfamily hydrolase